MRAAGMQNGNHKLTPRRVQAVRGAVAAGFTHAAVARASGLAASTVSDIANRKLWRDLESSTGEVRRIEIVVVPVGLAGDEEDTTVLLITGNKAVELRRVDIVLRRGPLTDEELSRD